MAIGNMKLSLDNIGKRFKFHWIFRQVSLDIQKGETLSIKGPNGSGKSTLLKVISGFLSPSEGKVVFEKEGALIKDYYKHVSYAAPYVDLVDQMTLREHLIFHQKFKSFKQSLTTEQVIEILQLSKSADKHIKDYSSGMQQRLRLGLAVLSEGDLCILDEPTTNLDVEGFQWYADLLSKFQEDTAMVIASNEERDFVNGGAVLNIRDYK